MTPPALEKQYIEEIPAGRKWTLHVTNEDGCADIWEKGYTEEESDMVITITPRSCQHPYPPKDTDTQRIAEKRDIELKILRENIKKKEFKPYQNHDKKAVWFDDISEPITLLRESKI